MAPERSGAGTDHDRVTQIVQRAASDWLSLRRAADETARQASVAALPALDAHLSSRLGPGTAVTVCDLGAGTGANMAWLAPRLAVRQRWTLVDRDEDLLHQVPTAAPSDAVLGVRRIAAELEDLQHDDAAGTPADLVTCSAFLDVLTVGQVRELAAFVARIGAAALFSLSVTGVVRMDPVLELDSRLNDVFNAHQVRHGLAGPGATAVAAQVLCSNGFTVGLIETPWVLGAQQAPLVERYLSDRVAAVIDHDPALVEPSRDWLGLRMSQLRDGLLSLRVGHTDLVALPSD
ncbi:class I SAM-dependent methyltransferase [Tessaracoccus antarcticus]|uniref:Class I SAM-dependent methyltransferase n=1 Tax=Tessaracoccus antarcticus TaxID=2479848 RepID=A0A3M0G5K9_9ACTN|nr:class I SAM-dependent methyltransferase [Tessaracoccus antarcticus]RMB60341.1 class I SAM-dependent methyltransferase [Tessaracoccus antarcticus]